MPVPVVLRCFGPMCHVGRVLAGLLVFAVAAQADEQRVLGRYWPAEYRVALGQVDHTPWTRLLQIYCDHHGNVDYGAWKAESTDLRALDTYLISLSRGSTDLPAKKPERLAFWINAYNALVVRGVLDAYPITRIDPRGTARLGYDIWRDLQLRVGDQAYSLDQIEQQQLRPLGDFRVHFAICKASKGSAPLLSRAYTAQRVDSQLAQQARKFFADRSRFRYDLTARRIRLSPLLKWYADDFGSSPQARMQAIAPYLPTEDARQLAQSGRAIVSFLSFQRALNDTRSVAARFSGRRF